MGPDWSNADNGDLFFGRNYAHASGEIFMRPKFAANRRIFTVYGFQLDRVQVVPREMRDTSWISSCDDERLKTTVAGWVRLMMGVYLLGSISSMKLDMRQFWRTAILTFDVEDWEEKMSRNMGPLGSDRRV
jgi:hypothetical protein